MTVRDQVRCRSRGYAWFRRPILLALAAAAAAPVAQAAPPAAAANRTLGFAVTSIYHDIHEDPAACPKGMNESQNDLYLTTVSESERKRLLHPDNAREYVFGKPSLNDAGKPICTDLHGPLGAARRPPMRVVAGSGKAFGINLDGQVSRIGRSAAPNTCAHNDFQGLSGERGVDNQFYRVVGCVAGYRKGGIMPEQTFGTEIRNGSWAILIQITDVDDAKNDPAVKVGMFSSQDPAPFPNGLVAVPYKSMSVSDNRRYHAHTSGKIVDGVLITEPVDFHFLVTPEQSPRKELIGGREIYLRGARLRLGLEPDGTAKGILAGYHDLRSYEENFIRYKGYTNFATGSAAVMKYSCVSLREALHRYADGYPDPKTGRCGAISTAFNVTAIPAFVIKEGEGSGVR
jgi:hypothetical protein